MTERRAWAFLTIEGAREYRGNEGYSDDPKILYRYDSDVANHLQVSAGDIAIIRGRETVFGIAEIEEIITGNAVKMRFRCPECQIANLRERKNADLPWRCRNGHQFSTPVQEEAEVQTFESRYGNSFRPCLELTVSQIADAVVRPSDQMSIKEIDLAKLESALASTAGDLIAKIVSDLHPPDFAYRGLQDAPSLIQERRIVLREIAQRRGQKAFRNRLIRRYGAACQISGCQFLELVEAAHLEPYSVQGDNSATNGLLLRSDLHTLFDLGYLAIEPGTLTVRFSPALLPSGYGQFDGCKVQLNSTAGPAPSALQSRWDLYKSKLKI